MGDGVPAPGGLGGLPTVAQGGRHVPTGLPAWGGPTPAGLGGVPGGRRGLGGAAAWKVPGSGGVGEAGGSGRRKMKADSVRLRWYRRKGRRAPGGAQSAHTHQGPPGRPPTPPHVPGRAPRGPAGGAVPEVLPEVDPARSRCRKNSRGFCARCATNTAASCSTGGRWGAADPRAPPSAVPHLGTPLTAAFSMDSLRRKRSRIAASCSRCCCSCGDGDGCGDRDGDGDVEMGTWGGRHGDRDMAMGMWGWGCGDGYAVR